MRPLGVLVTACGLLCLGTAGYAGPFVPASEVLLSVAALDPGPPEDPIAGSTLSAGIGAGAVDEYSPWEDTADGAYPPAGRGVSLRSQAATKDGLSQWLSADFRDGAGGVEAWTKSIRFDRYGFDPDAPPLRVGLSWDLSAAGGWRYVLYVLDATNRSFELRPGGSYCFKLGRDGRVMTLKAYTPEVPEPAGIGALGLTAALAWAARRRSRM